MTELDITCSQQPAGTWTCEVTVTLPDGARTTHRVGVAATDLARLDPGAPEPHVLVDRAFRFLLAREPATSILSAFDLPDIGRYFPDWEASVGPER